MHQLESMLKKMNLTVVLVYADWCGHCHTYKDTVWKQLEGLSNKKVGLAKLNEKALPHSPLSSAKINGYPSILVVGQDGKPAEFKDESTGEPTNALPNARDTEMMKGLVTGASSSKAPDVSSYPKTIYIGNESNVTKKAEEQEPEEVDAMVDPSELAVESKSLLNAPAEETATEEMNDAMNNAATTNNAENNAANNAENNAANNATNNAANNAENTTDATPEENASAILVNSESPVSSKVLPPSASDDLLDTNSSVAAVSGPENSSQLGGSLYMALLESAKVTAPAAILTAAAVMKSRRSRRAKAGKQKTRGRR